MKEMFVTVTGFGNYHGMYPFKIGNLIRCEKEPTNHYDHEAIKCVVPTLGTVGYIANSVHTVAKGTMSAGRVYDKVSKKFYIRVLFTTHGNVICRVEDGEPNDLRLELLSQLDDGWDKDETAHDDDEFTLVINVGGHDDEDGDDEDDVCDCGGEHEEGLVDDEDM